MKNSKSSGCVTIILVILLLGVSFYISYLALGKLGVTW